MNLAAASALSRSIESQVEMVETILIDRFQVLEET